MHYSDRIFRIDAGDFSENPKKRVGRNLRPRIMGKPEKRAERLDPSRFRTLSTEEQQLVNGGRAFCSLAEDDDHGHKFSSLLMDEDHREMEEAPNGE